jgi:peptidoglycan/LPS O-acetylase OafA/YrhL
LYTLVEISYKQHWYNYLRVLIPSFSTRAGMDKKKKIDPISAAPLKRSAIPQLDTIRVLAMLGIFLHHLWKTVIVSPQGMLQKTLDPLFSSASDGVVIFNIISGFLLAMPYLGPEHRPFPGYRYFLQKRFLRIIPPYYLALLVFTLANIIHFAYPLGPAFNMLLQHLLFVNSLDYSNMLSNFSPFWYLGQLAQFYLLFPVILGIFTRFGPRRAALSIVALCWGAWIFLAWYFPAVPGSYPNTAENLMHFNLPGRLPEFAVGMWLASLWNPSAASVRRSIFERSFSIFTGAMVFYFLAGLVLSPTMSLPFIHIFHVALSLIFFLILFVWTPAARAGEFATLKHFAELSYSIYIVHHPIFSYVGVMPSSVTHTVWNFVILAAVLLPLSYLAARVLELLSTWIIKMFSERKSVLSVS